MHIRTMLMLLVIPTSVIAMRDAQAVPHQNTEQKEQSLRLHSATSNAQAAPSREAPLHAALQAGSINAKECLNRLPCNREA